MLINTLFLTQSDTIIIKKKNIIQMSSEFEFLFTQFTRARDKRMNNQEIISAKRLIEIFF